MTWVSGSSRPVSFRMSCAVSPFVTAPFREKGFDAAAADSLGRSRAGNLFCAYFVPAFFPCAACIPGSQIMARAAPTLLGLGVPMLPVGAAHLTPKLT